MSEVWAFIILYCSLYYWRPPQWRNIPRFFHRCVHSTSQVQKRTMDKEEMKQKASLMSKSSKLKQGSFALECGKCRKVRVPGSKIRTIDSSHHVIIGNDLLENNEVSIRHQSRPRIVDNVQFTGEIICNKCPVTRQNRLGTTLKYQEVSSFFKHSVPWNKSLVPHGCAHAARRLRALFCKLYCHCLGKHSQTETSFKTNFLPMKGENSITSYCVVLTFKSVETQWLFEEIWVYWSIWYGLFSWIMTASIKLMTRTMDGCLILNKLGRRRVKLCQRVMATLQC